MPRLLNINSYHYRRGGADVVYLDHGAMFEREGWGTAYFAMHHPLNDPSEWSRFFVDELQHGHSYSLWQKLRMAGKVIHSYEARDKLALLLKEFRPDVAHVHNLYHHISPSVLPLLQEQRIPTVMTAHDLKLACPAHEMLAGGRICERCKGGRFHHCVAQRCVKGSLALSALVALESAVHRWAHSYTGNLQRIVVPSRFFGAKLVEWGVDAGLIHHVPNAINLQKFAPTGSVGTSFLYFGRMAESKGVRTLVTAAVKTGFDVTLVGTGELDSTLARCAQQHPNLRFVGRLSGEALFHEVASCRAVVLPSQWYENAPMSILEAYALGKPVIGARIGGIPEMVDETETGLLFDSGSADDLARAMTLMAGLPDDQLRQMGRAARARAERDYSSSKYLDRMRALYRELGVDA